MESALMYQTRVVAGEVRKPHRALGAHRNPRVSQQVRRLKILGALAPSPRPLVLKRRGPC